MSRPVFHLATIMDKPHSQGALEAFQRLASADSASAALTTDPDKADCILFVDLHQQPDDPLQRRLRRHPLVRRHPGKVAVYDERDNPIFVSFPGLFPAASGDFVARWPAVAAPYVFEPTPIDARSTSPDLLFSFRGRRSHPVREDILGLRHPRAVVEDSGEVDFFAFAGDEAHRAAVARYADLTRRSKFVLCPRGVGCSSFRLYETLMAGRVPVVVSDAWAPPPFVDWNSCVVRVPESAVAEIPTVLAAREREWATMVAGGARAVEGHLSSAARWRYLTDLLQTVLTPGRAPGRAWVLQPAVARAGLRPVKQRLRRRRD